MSMEYWKDGKKVELRPVFSKGKVGQIIILDHVSFGGNSEDPLARYPQPYAFTIVDKEPGPKGHYIIEDDDANRITIEFDGVNGWWFYDGNEWLAWQKGKEEEKLTRKNNKIAHLESQIALLRGILVEQGPRIVTETQAKQLGLK